MTVGPLTHTEAMIQRSWVNPEVVSHSLHSARKSRGYEILLFVNETECLRVVICPVALKRVQEESQTLIPPSYL